MTELTEDLKAALGTAWSAKAEITLWRRALISEDDLPEAYDSEILIYGMAEANAKAPVILIGLLDGKLYVVKAGYFLFRQIKAHVLGFIPSIATIKELKLPYSSLMATKDRFEDALFKGGVVIGSACEPLVDSVFDPKSSPALAAGLLTAVSLIGKEPGLYHIPQSKPVMGLVS